MWLVEIEGTPRQLLQTALTMPGGGETRGVYKLRAWSPSGRYILYFADPNTLAVRKINGLPPLGRENIDNGGSFYNVNVLWISSGDGALILDSDSRKTIYASTVDAALYDLRPFLGEFANGFYWVD